MEVTTMSSNGQIIIPVSLRRKLRLRSGDKVLFHEENGRIYLESATAKAFGEVAGDITVTATKKEAGDALRPFRRTGLAKGLINLPDDFDEHFNDMDAEIAAMFYGEET